MFKYMLRIQATCLYTFAAPLSFLTKITVAGLLVLSTVEARAADTPVFHNPAESKSGCGPLPKPLGSIIHVSTVEQLLRAVKRLEPGTSIIVKDGVYNLKGAMLAIAVPNVTLRSESGYREAVILDGNNKTREIIQIYASGVTIADLTLRNAYNHPVHVMSTAKGDTLNTRIYNVHIIDPGEQAIKINPTVKGRYTDYGEIACSLIEMTDAGRRRTRNDCYTGGIDAHDSRGWTVHDNFFQGFWCSRGLSEHAIHFWRNSRDTLVERNTIRNCARGIGFGMAKSETHRRYPDNGENEYYDHQGGIIRNNAVCADAQALFDSESGFDSGISLWYAKGARVMHNTVVSLNTSRSFSSIEWRFPATYAEILNNLVNINMMQRNNAVAIQSGNVSAAKIDWFKDVSNGDLHMSPLGVSSMNKVVVPPDVTDDIDGDERATGKSSYAGADGP